MRFLNLLIMGSLMGLLISVGTIASKLSISALPELPRPHINKDSQKFQTLATCKHDPLATVCVNPGQTAVLPLIANNPNPAIQCEIIMISGPLGSSLSQSSVGNPCKTTWRWPNAGPSNTYEAKFQTVCRNVPSDLQCTNSAIATFKILVNHRPVADAGSGKTGEAVNLVSKTHLLLPNTMSILNFIK